MAIDIYSALRFTPHGAVNNKSYITIQHDPESREPSAVKYDTIDDLTRALIREPLIYFPDVGGAVRLGNGQGYTYFKHVIDSHQEQIIRKLQELEYPPNAPADV